MLGVVFAPFIFSGVVAAFLGAIGTVLVIVFFMLVDATFTRWVLVMTGAILLLCRYMS